MATARVHFSKPASRAISYHRYPKAAKFDIDALGNLTVKDEDGKQLAVYADSNWTDAYFEEEVGELADATS